MLSQEPCQLIKGKFVILCLPEQEKHEFNCTCDSVLFFYVYHDLSLLNLKLNICCNYY